MAHEWLILGSPDQKPVSGGQFCVKSGQIWEKIQKIFQEQCSFDFSVAMDSSQRVDNFRVQVCRNRTKNG